MNAQENDASPLSLMKHLISTLLAIFIVCPAHGDDLTVENYPFLKGLLKNEGERKEEPDAKAKEPNPLLKWLFGSGSEGKEKQDTKAQEPMLGTLDSHRYIWTRYQEAVQTATRQREDYWKATTDWQRAEAEHQTFRAPVIKTIDNLKDEIVKAEREIKTDVFLTKGEFEKSVDFDARKEQAKNERNKVLGFRIAVWRADLADYEKRLERLGKPLTKPVEKHPQDFVVPPFIPSTHLFWLQVEMGPYDADKEYLSTFKHTKQFRCSMSNETVRIFRVSGEIAGIEIVPKRAEQVRAASNKKTLWAVVEGSPTPAHFNAEFSVPRTAEQIARQEEDDIAKQRETLHKRYGKEYSETTNSLMAFGAGLLAHALGAKDPGEYQEATAEGIRSSNENRERELRSITARPVQREDTYPGWVIDVGWTGKATPKALFEWNSDTKQWDKIWDGR